MSRCQCVTIKGERCKLQASKKSGDDKDFCWRHQNCQQVFSKSPTKVSKKSPRKVSRKVSKKSPVTVSKKVSKKSPIKVSKKSPIKVSKKSPIKVSKKISKKGRKSSLPKKVDLDWCGSNNIVRANIVKNLSTEDINNVCLTNKVCREKVCNNNKLWQGLIQQVYGKQITEEQIKEGLDPRSYYYSLGVNAYATGYNASLVPLLPKGYDTDKFTLVKKSVKYVDTAGDITAFIDADDTLSILTKEKVVENYMKDIKQVWIGRAVYIWALDGTVYINGEHNNETYKNVPFLKNIKDLIISDLLIYADGICYPRYNYENFIPESDLSVNSVKTKSLEKVYFKINNEPVNIKYWDGWTDGTILLDTANNLYYSDDSVSLVDENVDFAQLGKTNFFGQVLYYSKDDTFYAINLELFGQQRLPNKRTLMSWNLGSKITKISIYQGLGLKTGVFILTQDGTLYLYGGLIRFDMKHILPKNYLDFTEDNILTQPLKILENILDFSVYENTLIILTRDD